MFSEYILILLWIGILAYFQPNFCRSELVCGKKRWRTKWIFAIILFIPLILMTKNRSLYFGDSMAYQMTYDASPTTFSELAKYTAKRPKDKGFYFLTGLIHTIFGGSYLTYFTVVAIIHVFGLIMLYRKYSDNFAFSVLLFVLSTDFYSWMWNGVRQFSAVAVVAAFTFLYLRIREKKSSLIYACIVILLASTLHQSALLMIPFIIIAQGKPWNKLTILFTCVIILCCIFVGEFTSIMDSALENTQYTNVVSDYTGSGDDGTHPLRVLVYAVPTIVAFFSREEIAKANDPIINFCVNMSILSTGLYFISMFTSGIYLGRLPIYASLYNYILLPWEVKHSFSGGLEKVAMLGVLVFYLAFYYFQTHMVWGFY